MYSSSTGSQKGHMSGRRGKSLSSFSQYRAILPSGCPVKHVLATSLNFLSPGFQPKGLMLWYRVLLMQSVHSHFHLSPLTLSLRSLFLPFIFPLVCIFTLHCRLMDLESEKKNKKGGGREWDDIQKWTAQKWVCLYVGLGGLGVNGWGKCNSSIFSNTVTVSLFPSALQVSISLYSNYPDWVSWGWRDEGGKGSNRGDTVLVTA